nr:proline-rich receptor-like protein kinase PERK2 [Aegilops tauschii subsp. strangulata]
MPASCPIHPFHPSRRHPPCPLHIGIPSRSIQPPTSSSCTTSQLRHAESPKPSACAETTSSRAPPPSSQRSPVLPAPVPCARLDAGKQQQQPGHAVAPHVFSLFPATPLEPSPPWPPVCRSPTHATGSSRRGSCTSPASPFPRVVPGWPPRQHPRPRAPPHHARLASASCFSASKQCRGGQAPRPRLSCPLTARRSPAGTNKDPAAPWNLPCLELLHLHPAPSVQIRRLRLPAIVSGEQPCRRGSAPCHAEDARSSLPR